MSVAPSIVAPQDFGPPPRIVRWRRTNAQVFVFRYLLTPILVALLVAAAVMIGVALFGERTEGKIIGIREKKMSDNASAHFAEYAFDYGGRHYESQQRIFDYRISPWTPGMSVIVRSANILGYRYSTLADGWGDLINLNAFAIYTLVLVVVFGLPTALYKGWLVPARQRRILREGTITAGVVEEMPPGPQFKCRYSYTDASGGQHMHRANVSPMLAVRMRVGDPLTIAYDPNRSSRHLVYEFCDFRIMGALDG